MTRKERNVRIHDIRMGDRGFLGDFVDAKLAIGSGEEEVDDRFSPVGAIA